MKSMDRSIHTNVFNCLTFVCRFALSAVKRSLTAAIYDPHRFQPGCHHVLILIFCLFIFSNLA